MHDGSYAAVLHTEVPLGGVEQWPIICQGRNPQKPKFLGSEYSFQAKFAWSLNNNIFETTRSINTVFEKQLPVGR